MGYKLSPSRMNLYAECPRCFYLRVNEKVERPSGPFPSLPSGVDRELKDHFDRYREKGETPPEIEEAEIDAKLFSDKGFLEKARDWRSEPRWEDPATGAVLRGGVDDLLENDEGLIVLDYKTRGYPPKGKNGAPDYYERQVNLYNLILRENGYSTADFGLILYFYPKRVQEDGDLVFENELRKVPVDTGRAKRTVREAVETLEGEIPEHSKTCDYRDWNPST